MVIFTMTQIEKIEYSRVRLEKALDFLKAAKKTFEIGEYSYAVMALTHKISQLTP